MTACVNRKHTKKVAAVVTASLVGALSLGVAPVAAMADTGIETLAADWSTGATVTAATDGKGGNVTNPATATLAKGKYLVPTEVTNSLGDTTEIDDSFTLTYYSNATGYVATASRGNFTSVDAAFDSAIVDDGTYYVQIKKGTKTVTVYFKIGAESTVEKVHAYVGSDSSKTAIFYTGNNISVNFAKEDGTAVTPDANGVTWTGVDGDSATLKAAGTYYADFTDTDGNSHTVEVVVSPLDLSTAAISMADTDTTNGLVGNASSFLRSLEINGASVNSSVLRVTSMDTPDGSNEWAQTGEFKVTIASNNDSNVKGSATVTFSQLDNNVFNNAGTVVKYGSRSMVWDGTSWNYQVLLLDGETFDASKVSVVDGATSTVYKGDQLEMTFSKDGETVDASEVTDADIYDLHIRIKPVQSFATGAWTGGSCEAKITLTGSTVSANTNLGFYLDGELLSDPDSVEYTGENYLDAITTVVKDGNGNTYTAGTDYTVEVKKDGKVVDSIVDAGKYEIAVNPVTFEFTRGTDNVIELNVAPVSIDQLVADVDNMKYDADKGTGNLETVTVPTQTNPYNTETNEFYVAYTGSAVEVPGILYGVEDSSTGKWTYKELASDLYNIVSIKDKDGKTVKEAVDEGTYTVKVALSDAAKSNYGFATTGVAEFKFTIKKFGHFTDVDSTKWYSVPVEKAADLGYVNGISGTNLFAPEADITRADAVCILFNMAGGKSMPDDDFSFDENTGYNTGFSDVDGHAYFAKALAWARAFGVANGYGDGTFAPYAQITREEFASMLANYAKAMGKFEAADEGALDGMSDASTVSDWAEDNVAWAVENGVMGNGGFVAGQSNITRAEVAAMAVNYQPEALEK